MVLDDVLGWIVHDRESCRELADELRQKHPHATPEQLARHAIADSRQWAVAAGGATGAAANPLIMIPAAVADIAAMLKIEGRMAGTIAAIMDPPSLLDEKTFNADVLAIVFPGAVSQALRQFGLRAGQRVTRRLIQKFLSEQVMKDATRFAAKHLMIRVTRKAIVSKTVPLVGAGIGAAWNWVELDAVGKRAIRYYQRRAIGPTPKEKSLGAPAKFSLKNFVRKLPWRKPTSEPAPAPKLLPPPDPDPGR